MKSSKSVCALRCAQPHMLRTWPGAPRHYPRLGRGKWLPLTHIRFAASASGGSGKRLTLLSGSAVHEKANFGGRDVALVADSYDAVAVFDAIGGWHSAGGNDFAQSLRNTVRQLLSRSEQLKHGPSHPFFEKRGGESFESETPLQTFTLLPFPSLARTTRRWKKKKSSGMTMRIWCVSLYTSIHPTRWSFTGV